MNNGIKEKPLYLFRFGYIFSISPNCLPLTLVYNGIIMLSYNTLQELTRYNNYRMIVTKLNSDKMYNLSLERNFTSYGRNAYTSCYCFYEKSAYNQNLALEKNVGKLRQLIDG